MRYAKDHKEQTRRRVVETAATLLRRDGIVASGVVGLMAEAGLTQGGFYSHFASKDALVEEALTLAQKGAVRGTAQRAAEARERGERPIAAIIDSYLSLEHVDIPGQGCTFASLGAEIGRQSDAIRRSAFAVMNDTIDAIAREMPASARELAVPLFTLMAGTLQYARLAGTRAEQRAILDRGRRAAYLLIGDGGDTECAAQDV